MNKNSKMNLIKIESLNCRGLRDIKKRLDLFDDFKKRGIHIINLQETHLISNDLLQLKKIWNCKFLIAGENKQSLGVMIILNNNFEYKIHNVNKDHGGRFIIIDLEIIGVARFLMINIYGPNKDIPGFFDNLFNILDNENIKNWIITGDWNLVLNQNLDTWNYKTINNPNSTNKVKQYIKKYDLIDIWRDINNDKKNFTWFRTNPNKAARLDYFLITPSILNILSEPYIKIKYRSDHCKIGLNLIHDKSERGKGLWKLNSDLINDFTLNNKIKEDITLMIEVHACTPYNPAFIKNHINNFPELMISIELFWEMLLTKLRGSIISYAAKIKRERLQKENKLIYELENLNHLFILNMNDKKTENEIKIKNQELEELREIKLKGAFIRSRSKMLVQEEKPNKLFLNLENNNFISKNIKELINMDKEKITEPNKILEEMRLFYEKLYAKQEIIKIEDSLFKNFKNNLNKLDEKESSKLDDKITLIELENQVFSTGNGKSPGPDGFTNEFFKNFWDVIKLPLLILMNHFFESQNIPENFLSGIITCIPKGNKARNSLKNWRPITLLNSIYKFYSGIWANRIKQFLPKLIGESQKGFVQGRFIGENTVLTLDILNETKFKGEEGLLILVDFEKAFDSISWEYISKTLQIFNFSEKTISIIESLQKNSKSKILQNGHLSEIITLGRGCRQGDPISPYIFVLAVELLGEAFRTNLEIKGIIVGGEEHRISQFADDTTLFMQFNEKNLRICMSILNEFHLISGLKINVEKTKAIKFGVSRDSRMTLCDDLDLVWTQEFTSLGIDYNIKYLNRITDLNLEGKLKEMEKLISVWKIRNLTLIGKITIIKTLLISKIIHILLSLPRPSEEFFVKIEKVFLNFLWQNKPPKFKLSNLEKLIACGGLQFPDLRKIDIGMKASWLKRLYKSNTGWASTPISYGLDKIYIYGDVFMQKKTTTLQNPFWRDVVYSVHCVYTKSTFKSLQQVLSVPLWLNSHIMVERIYSWETKGIYTIGDMLDKEGHILSHDYVKNNLQLKCDFLLYNRLKKRIQNSIGNLHIMSGENLRPRLPFLLYSIEVKGNKNTYFNLLENGNGILNELQNKWSEKLNDNIMLDTISNAFKNAQKFSPSVYQHFTQFKLLHRRIVNNKLLHKMKILDNPLCLFCNQIETIEHIYLECPNVIYIWHEVEKWIRSMQFPHFKISDTEKIFGEKYNNELKQLVITSTKDIIYFKRKSGDNMYLTDVKRVLVKNLHILKTQKSLKQKADGFFEEWNTLIENLRIDPVTRDSWYIL